MSKEQQAATWTNKQVTVFLATPLSPLGTEGDGQANVFVIKAKVVEQVGSGMVLAIQALFDDRQNPVQLGSKKIFLPFSKVDYIALP